MEERTQSQEIEALYCVHRMAEKKVLNYCNKKVNKVLYDRGPLLLWTIVNKYFTLRPGALSQMWTTRA
ncbi:hypothetical protein KATP_40650 [Kluyvera ascorbata]|nr:hypothetical protein KATP_40650 [Kluyvera ascorbata]